MQHRSFWLGACCITGCLFILAGQRDSFSGAAAKDKVAGKEKAKLDINLIHLEVDALQVIDTLELTTKQLEVLASLARETSEKPRARKPAKVSAEYRKTLIALHVALKKNESEQADELQDKLSELAEKEEPEFDDAVETTEAARNKATELLRQLRVAQVMSYLNTIEINDPIQIIEDALTESQESKGQEWTDARNEAADTVGQLLGGVSQTKSDSIRKNVIKLLNKAHQMKAGEFAKAHEALKQEAHDIVGKMTPFEIIRAQVAAKLAEFLSNPRLGKAAEIRLANQK